MNDKSCKVTWILSVAVVLNSKIQRGIQRGCYFNWNCLSVSYIVYVCVCVCLH